MAHKKSVSLIPSPPPISIGNCQVQVEAKSFESEWTENSLRITFAKDANLKISVMENWNGKVKQCGHQEYGEKENGNYSFELVNPNERDCTTTSLVQLGLMRKMNLYNFVRDANEVINIYAKELPAMKYAANTGKHSLFLEKCVSSGKYYTLLLRFKDSLNHEEVIAATTYQIISADTLYAEIPLAAVRSQYQQKGIGRLLYMELRRRLQNVGIRTIFCWGDKESEGFWLKQGFIVIGQVDAKGKARRLPIRPNIRRMLCFPGGSSLMVSYLNNESLTNPPERPVINLPEKNSSSYISQKQDSRVPEGDHSSKEALNQNIRSEMTPRYDSDMMETVNVSDSEGVNESELEPCLKQRSFAAPQTNKRTWESSSTSLNSKKVKGGYQNECHLDSNSFLLESNKNTTMHKNCDSPAEPDKDNCPKDPLTHSSKYYYEHKALGVTSERYSSEGIPSLGKDFRIILMNIADDNKKAILTKIIESLGGDVTSDGSICTHVVTGKVRITLNFCKALCSGSWIISPSWLKESYRNGRFVDEMPFILKDEDYEVKYGIELKEAVFRTRVHPQSLLDGYDICVAAHVQPPASMLSAIVKSAGGNVLGGLEKVKDVNRTIFVVCEEDIDEARLAAEKGIRCFRSEWFMNCIMQQQLDLGASQFAVSL